MSDAEDDLLEKQGPSMRRMIVVYALIAICLGVEGVLLAGDAGAFDRPRFRAFVYEQGGFWAGLFNNWQPNYPRQKWVMFLTYSFLHVSLWHLILNMVTLFWLGRTVVERVGGIKFLMVYTASILGGGAGFALLTNSFDPMVGASGALFGLAGSILAWEYVDRFSLREGLWPVAFIAGLLVAMNVALYYTMNGRLAWETHLGGFVTGWFMATLLDPRGRI